MTPLDYTIIVFGHIAVGTIGLLIGVALGTARARASYNALRQRFGWDPHEVHFSGDYRRVYRGKGRPAGSL